MMENKTHMNKQICIVAIFSLLAGCIQVIKPSAVEVDESFTKFLRGTVYIESSGYKLRLCGTGKIVELLDPNKKLIPHIYLNDEIIPSVYLEFDASAVLRLDWQVSKVYFSSQKPHNCGAKIEKVDFLVNAVDHHWQAKINARDVAI